MEANITFITATVALLTFTCKEFYLWIKKANKSLEDVDQRHLDAIHENTSAIFVLTGKIEFLEKSLDGLHEEFQGLRQEVTVIGKRSRHSKHLNGQ